MTRTTPDHADSTPAQVDPDPQAVTRRRFLELAALGSLALATAAVPGATAMPERPLVPSTVGAMATPAARVPATLRQRCAARGIQVVVVPSEVVVAYGGVWHDDPYIILSSALACSPYGEQALSLLLEVFEEDLFDVLAQGVTLSAGEMRVVKVTPRRGEADG